MEFAASDPIRPLTDARRALIGKRLRELFPNFHTPNHPTYAAMIYRAIAELKEPSGSSEESISEFIRKQYDDLPWAHFTLLKHHLQNLCECGEIVATIDKCYLLADGITNPMSATCSSPKREPMQQTEKQQRKQTRRQAKRRRKNQVEEQTQRREPMEVIEEQHNLMIEEQNLAADPHDELMEGLNVLQKGEQERQIVIIEGHNCLERQILDSEHLEKNQLDVPSPERPPGFNLVIHKELPELEQQQIPEESLDFCCRQKTLKCQPEKMTTGMDLHISAKQLEVKQQNDHPYPEGPPGLAADPWLVEHVRQPEFINSERLLEPDAQQKASKYHIMTSPSLALPMNQEPLEHNKPDVSNSGRFLEVKMTMEGGVDDISLTLKHILEEQRKVRYQSRRQSESEQQTTATVVQQQPPLQLVEGMQGLKSVKKLPEMRQQKGKKHGRKKHAKSRPEAIITRDVLTNSNNGLELRNTGPPGPKLETVAPPPEQQLQQGKLCEGQKSPESEIPTLKQRVGQHCARKKTRSKTKAMESRDVPMTLEQLVELPNPNLCVGPGTRKVEPCSEEEDQQANLSEGNKAPESLIEGVEAALDLTKDVSGAALDLTKDVSVSDRPLELDLTTTEQLSQTDRRRQLWHSGRKTSASKPRTTPKTESLPSSEVQYQEPELPNRESPPELKQTPVEESFKTTEQQAKHHGRQKWVKSQPKRTGLNMAMAPQESEHKRLRPRPRPPKPEQVTGRTMGHHEHDQQKQQLLNRKNVEYLKKTLAVAEEFTTQEERQQPENPLDRDLEPQHHKGMAVAASTTEESVSVKDQHEQQRQLDCQDGGRPCGQKSDTTLALIEYSPSYHENQHQQQHPAPRGRGRPRKYLHNPQQKQQVQIKRKGRGRPPKLRTDSQTMESKPQGRGRPRKLK
ncbi:hypothetical protein U1Q18_002111 [Sarracenia purpurea var. burkii]